MKKNWIIFLVLLCGISARAQHRIKVMSYNIRYENAGDGPNQWNNRKDSVAKVIRKNDPDIIGTQEALHHQVTDLDRMLNGYESFGVGRNDGKEQGEYAAIFYHKHLFERTAGSTFWLSETPGEAGSKGWDAADVRIVTWCALRHKKSGETIYVFNTHFDHKGKTARKKSAALLREKIRSIAGDDLFILTGDLNSEPGSEPYRVLTGTEDHLSVTDAAHKSKEATFHGFKISNTHGKRIDYIFCSPKMKPDFYTVIYDNNGVYYPSDHLPIVADILF